MDSVGYSPNYNLLRLKSSLFTFAVQMDKLFVFFPNYCIGDTYHLQNTVLASKVIFIRLLSEASD